MVRKQLGRDFRVCWKLTWKDFSFSYSRHYGTWYLRLWLISIYSEPVTVLAREDEK